MMAEENTKSYMIKHSLDVCCLTGFLRICFETSRLIIRNFQEEDFFHSVALYGNPEITRLFDSGNPRTPLQVRELINVNGIRHFMNGDPWGIFSIFSKETGEFIGHVDLLPSDIDPNWIEIGYILSKNAWGSGLCSEVVKCLVFDYIPMLIRDGYTTPQAPIQGIMATVHPENTPSKKVLQKLGMKYQRSCMRFGQPRHVYSFSFSSDLLLECANMQIEKSLH